ncbi:hypothetical protein V5799_026482 [Amblyomma americanum]|uniref:Secreted protein n=1 Tax=Amblyomma americanum TaxID=6943 RepID=A0AAQ4DIG1_AMBAM
MKPSEPFTLFLQAFLCHASTLDHASSTCFVASIFRCYLGRTCARVPFDAYCGNDYGQHQLLKLSRHRSPLCGHVEASRTKPSEPFILFLRAFLCHASTLDHASSTCLVASIFRCYLGRTCARVPFDAYCGNDYGQHQLLKLSRHRSPLCGHGEAFRMKPSEPFILFLRAFLCHASTLDHASSTCFVASIFRCYLGRTCARVTFDAYCGNDYGQHQLLKLSRHRSPLCGHSEAFRMKPSEPFILFLQAFLCHASTLDHASTLKIIFRCYLGRTCERVPFDAYSGNDYGQHQLLKLSRHRSPLCGHVEASRTKPSEPFTLFLQAFLCHASTLDHASSTCFVASIFRCYLGRTCARVPFDAYCSNDYGQHQLLKLSRHRSPLCGQVEASRTKPSEPFILFLRAFLCHASTLDHASSTYFVASIFRCYLGRTCARVPFDAYCGNDYGQHQLLKLSRHRSPLCGHSEAFRMKPSEPFILFLQAFLCHALTLDHASTLKIIFRCYLGRTCERVPFDAYCGNDYGEHQLLKLSRHRSPLCGHGEAFRMKPSEPFILFLQAFLCHASTLDHAYSFPVPCFNFGSCLIVRALSLPALKIIFRCYLGRTCERVPFDAYSGNDYGQHQLLKLSRHRSPLCGHSEAFRMKPSEPFILFLQAFMCHASALDHASSFPVPCFNFGSRHKLSCAMLQLWIMPIVRALSLPALKVIFRCYLGRTCARVPFDAYCGNDYGQHQLLKLSRHRSPLCGHGEAFRMKPSEPFILFLQAFLCHASTLDHAYTLKVIFRCYLGRTCARVPFDAFCGNDYGQHQLLKLSRHRSPLCGHGEAFRMKPSEPIILFLQAFLCHASTLDHASTLKMIFRCYLGRTCERVPFDAYCGNDYGQHQLLTLSRHRSPLCGHGEAFRMKPSEPFILFLQAFLCHASTLDHASTLKIIFRCYLGRTCARVPFDAYCGNDYGQHQLLKLSRHRSPLCGHSEAFRMKPSEPFILFLQAFLCHASTLDSCLKLSCAMLQLWIMPIVRALSLPALKIIFRCYLGRTCERVLFDAYSGNDYGQHQLLKLSRHRSPLCFPVPCFNFGSCLKYVTLTLPALKMIFRCYLGRTCERVPFDAYSGNDYGQHQLLKLSRHRSPLCGHSEAFRMNPSEPFIQFLQAFLCHASTLDHAYSFPVPCFNFGSCLKLSCAMLQLWIMPQVRALSLPALKIIFRCYLGRTCERVHFDAYSGNDYGQHQLLKLSRHRSPLCGHSEAFRMKPSEPFILFLQAFMCHASALDHASSFPVPCFNFGSCLKLSCAMLQLWIMPQVRALSLPALKIIFRCYLGRTCERVPFDAYCGNDYGQHQLLKLSRQRSPLCGHGEASRTKPSEPFILFLQAFCAMLQLWTMPQAFLCHASTLDHAYSFPVPCFNFGSCLIVRALSLPALKMIFRCYLGRTCARVPFDAYCGNEYGQHQLLKLSRHRSPLCGHSEAFRMKPSEPFILFLQAFLCHASTLDHAYSFPVPCFNFGSCLKLSCAMLQLWIMPIVRALSLPALKVIFRCYLGRTCARVPFDAFCGNDYGQHQLLKLSRHRSPLCGHSEAFRMKPSEPFILFLQAFCAMLQLWTMPQVCALSLPALKVIFRCYLGRTCARVPFDAFCGNEYGQHQLLKLSRHRSPLCGHSEAFRMKPSEPFILFLQAFLCHASTLDHAYSLPVPCFNFGSCLKLSCAMLQLWVMPQVCALSLPALKIIFRCYLGWTCERVPFDAYCGNDYGQHQLLKLSRHRSPLCGHGEAFRMKPSERLSCFYRLSCAMLQLWVMPQVCALSLPALKIIFRCYLGRTCERVPFDAYCGNDYGQHQLLKLSRHRSPLCGHGEAYRMKPYELFILFL